MSSCHRLGWKGLGLLDSTSPEISGSSGPGTGNYEGNKQLTGSPPILLVQQSPVSELMYSSANPSRGRLLFPQAMLGLLTSAVGLGRSVCLPLMLTLPHRHRDFFYIVLPPVKAVDSLQSDIKISVYTLTVIIHVKFFSLHFILEVPPMTRSLLLLLI